MLTQKQEQFITKIPEDATATINPWNPKAAEYAKNLIQKIEELGLEVFWEGSLSLGIAGENDIDLYIFYEPQNFDIYLFDIVHILGGPTYTFAEKILWRVKQDGYKIDASLAAKDSPDVKMDMIFYTSLKENPVLLKEYEELKTPGLSAREYYIRKNEFYNKITSNK